MGMKSAQLLVMTGMGAEGTLHLRGATSFFEAAKHLNQADLVGVTRQTIAAMMAFLALDESTSS